jgi:hypothetical protein
MIILVCWAHQLNLIMRDVLNVKHKLIDVIKITLAIITWLNGHSMPLAWLYTEQLSTYSRSLTIFLPIVSHWLAHYHAISQLLAIEGAILCLWFGRAEEIISKAGNAEKQGMHVECSSQ